MTRAVIVIGIALIAAGSGAAATQAGRPSPPLEAAPGEFVWHDLVTDDPAACRAFYAALFGWRFEAGDGVDPGYTVITHDARPIGGIVKRRSAAGESGPAQWLAYVTVADVDLAAAAFVKSGGRLYRGPLNARKDLRIAAVADAQGAALGLTNRGPRTAAPGAAALHDWLWMEYVAREPELALAFYADVFGYRHEISETREGFTYYLLATDRPHAGLFKTLWVRHTSAWLPYVRVTDPAAMAARVEQLGGTVVIPPQPRVRNNSLAIVLDPTGAPLALQKFPFDQHTGGIP